MTSGFKKTAFAMATEMAVAVPLVMTERLLRMVLAGSSPSKRDPTESNRMYTEKAKAFTESWYAMTSAVIAVNRELASSFFRPFDALSLDTFQTTVSNVADEALAPFHRTTTDNVVRLAAVRRLRLSGTGN